MKLILSFLIAMVSVLGSICSAEAQPASRPPYSVSPADSSKVYVYVSKMPEYPGGLASLAADLRREFQVASAAAGCVTPALPVFVGLVVGPSGYVYAARSLNSAAINQPPSLPLPPACEAAIAVAARRLSRLQPGSQNNKFVTVELVVKLLPGK